MKANQMELSLAIVAAQVGNLNRSRHVRSGWWFQQMRKAVDKAGGSLGAETGTSDRSFETKIRPVLTTAEAVW